jgi:hypothetical protein
MHIYTNFHGYTMKPNATTHRVGEEPFKPKNSTELNDYWLAREAEERKNPPPPKSTLENLDEKVLTPAFNKVVDSLTWVKRFMQGKEYQFFVNGKFVKKTRDVTRIKPKLPSV